MKTRICLCVLAALLMIPVAVTAQTKKLRKKWLFSSILLEIY